MKSSKAKTLKLIQNQISKFKIPEFIFFENRDWQANASVLIEKIKHQFKDDFLAIRSSAANEDGIKKSMAGEFETVLNVSANEPSEISEAIIKVIHSYKRNGSLIDQDEVIIQRMLRETIMSGVVFTHDLNTGAPYYVINYDDISGKTNTVTSGDGKYANRTLYIHRGSSDVIRSSKFKNLLDAVVELENIMDNQFLDIEFAMDSELNPYLFQVRMITTQPNWNRAVSKRIDSALNGIQAFVKKRFKPMDGVYGKTTILGQMPDWNPAEMIGRAPRKLAYSLYETLITDHAWRVARQKMGYAVPHGQPLMVSLAGQPYIDTRLSFHSYLPASLSSNICEKLVDVWVAKLNSNPQLHDKVEFDVAITTYSFDLEDKIKLLTGGVLDNQEKAEFIDSLKELTINLIKDKNEGGIEAALDDIKTLQNEQKKNFFGKNHSDFDLYSLFKMIDHCIWYGTIPFSILARHGFIARTILLSLEKIGIFSKDEVHQIQSGIKTVAGDLVDDILKLQENKIDRTLFMEKYGHLRPGTYDILSLRYDQIDNFGVGNIPVRHGQEADSFEISTEKKLKINKILKREGFDEIDADYLMDYIRKATEGREFGKFVFTRTVSDILEIIANVGVQNGLSRDEISHISLHDIIKSAKSSVEENIEDRLRKKSQEGAEHHAVSSAIRLPQVLGDEQGVHVVPFQISHPNFITDKRVDAESIKIVTGNNPPEIAGKIVMIESADPGFDWIFAHNIAGLVTKYGGANSHMAIRCAEFNIPAAIGCGELKFENLVHSSKISLDCAAGLIQPQI